jgi:hypothetical protein
MRARPAISRLIASQLTLDAAFTVAAGWTLLCWVAVVLGLNLSTLLCLSPLVLLPLLALRLPYQDDITAAPFLRFGSPATPRGRLPSALAFWFTLAVCWFAILWVSVPNPDDAFYLNVIESARSLHHQPLLRFDTLYGRPDLPLYNPVNKVMSHLLGVAAFARLTALPTATVYHIILPMLFAGLAVLAHALLLRRLIGQLWPVALLITLALLLTWGGNVETLGNYVLIRLFQGKGLFIAICSPAILLYALQFAQRPSWRTWLLLCAANIASVGATNAAMVLAPLATAMALTAATPLHRSSIPRLAAGALASAPCVTVLLCIWFAYPLGRVAETSTIGTVALSLGSPLRIGITVAAPLLILTLSGSQPLRRYAILTLLVVLNPLSGMVLDHAAHNLAWRIAWSVPFFALVAIALTLLLASRRTAIVGLALLAAFILSGDWPLRHSTITTYGFHTDLYGPYHAIALRACQRTAAGGTILAPESVSQVIAMLPDRPALVGVRTHYLDVSGQSLPPNEARWRMALFRGITIGQQKFFADFAAALEARPVETVVLPQAYRQAQRFRREFATLGYTLAETVDNHEIWIRPCQ